MPALVLRALRGESHCDTRRKVEPCGDVHVGSLMQVIVVQVTHVAECPLEVIECKYIVCCVCHRYPLWAVPAHFLRTSTMQLATERLYL